MHQAFLLGTYLREEFLDHRLCMLSYYRQARHLRVKGGTSSYDQTRSMNLNRPVITRIDPGTITAYTDAGKLGIG